MSKIGVLVVENSPELRNALVLCLNTFGIPAVGAADTEEAMAHLPNVSCVVTDQGLLGVSGIELMRRVRSAYPDMRLVLVSGSVTAEVRQAAFEAGARMVLEKPINMVELVHATGLPGRTGAGDEYER